MRSSHPSPGLYRVLLALCIALLPVGSSQPRPAAALAYPDPPQVLYQDLFVAVQSSQLYEDGKAFPDAIPRGSPKDILAQYHAQRPRTPEALQRFVDAHFAMPSEATTPPSTPEQVPIVAHIDRLWDVLTRQPNAAAPRSSLLPMPGPYVVPGGRFREMYYWDSYFTMLGLAQSGRHDLVEDMVRDFAYLIDTYGHVPNGARTYYLSRSQPPFFFAMVGLLSTADPASSFARFLPQLRREYAFWMQGATGLHRGKAHRRAVMLPDGSVLNRYWDDRDTPRDESYREDTALALKTQRKAPQVYRDIRAAAESGWDFGSRWFADGRTKATIDTTQIIPVDLNSLLFGLENAIRTGCQRASDTACAEEFGRRAAARRAAIDRYSWDEATGSYLDYRWTRHAKIPRISAATLYPLFVGAASEVQAASVATAVSRSLLKEGGIVTTVLDTGQQWDAPNGWPPLQWIAVSGLRDYHDTQLAETVACRWMLNVNRVYRDTGKLVEKYDVTTSGRSGGGGEYPLQDGFGWTNGVMRKLIALYPTDAAYSSLEQCPLVTKSGSGRADASTGLR
jgi:alpha,alpha-trehalase